MESKKWYQKNFGIIALLVIFFPVGLYLMWKHAKWNKKVKWAVSGFFAFLVMVELLSPGTSDDLSSVANSNETSTEVAGLVTSELPHPSSSTSPTPATAPNNPNIQLFKVTKVIDGDTIEIEGGQRVRYIGIDTPELGGSDCYATQAYEKNRELVGGGTVGLEKDVSETDRYGRLLRYVYMGDLLINDVLVRQGYAHASSYPPDVKNQEQFTQAEREARDNNRGLWNSCTSQTETAPQPVTSSGSCKYDCSGPDKDCSDFSTHAEAQTFFECCGFTATNDPMKLDSVKVGDGIACESLP